MWNYSWLKVIISDFDFLSQVHIMHLSICIQYWFVFRNPRHGGGVIEGEKKLIIHHYWTMDCLLKERCGGIVNSELNYI